MQATLTTQNRAFSDSTTLSSKGQLVIPKAMRELAKWSAGDALQVLMEGEEIRIRRIEPVSKSAVLAQVAGCLKKPALAKRSDADIKRLIGQRLKAKLAL